MEKILLHSVSFALVASFLLSLARKWGWIEWVQVNGNKILSTWANCNFCLSFWTVLAVSIIAVVATGDFTLFLCPVLGTTICMILL